MKEHLLALCTVLGACVLSAGCASGGQAEANSGSTTQTSIPASTHREHHRHRHWVAVHRRQNRRRARHHHHAARPVHVAGVPAVDVPNRTLTPGAVLTTSVARMCVPGYSSSVRDVPDSEKEAVYAEYGVPHVPYQHEVDHLVSLEVDGSNAITNLWPEPYAGRWGARTKDVLENKLHDLVCSGELSLAFAQHIEATNWVLAYKRYVGGTPAVPSGSGSGGGSGGGGGGGSGGGNCTPGYSPCLVNHGGADYDCYGDGGNGPSYTQ